MKIIDKIEIVVLFFKRIEYNVVYLILGWRLRVKKLVIRFKKKK